MDVMAAPRVKRQMTVGTKLGSGGFGTVTLHRDQEILVAGKQVKQAYNSLIHLREIACLSLLDHPNIIKLIQPGRHLFTMELAEESLQEYLVKQALPVPQRDLIIEQITSALRYLHQQGLIHRDIKPGNILLLTDLTPKLADFGLAIYAVRRPFEHNMTTICYSAPELLLQQDPWRPGGCYTKKIDYWAWGCTIYEMYHRKILFNVIDTASLIRQHQQPLPELPGPARSLLKHNPGQRQLPVGGLEEEDRVCSATTTGSDLVNLHDLDSLLRLMPRLPSQYARERIFRRLIGLLQKQADHRTYIYAVDLIYSLYQPGDGMDLYCLALWLSGVYYGDDDWSLREMTEQMKYSGSYDQLEKKLDRCLVALNYRLIRPTVLDFYRHYSSQLSVDLGQGRQILRWWVSQVEYVDYTFQQIALAVIHYQTQTDSPDPALIYLQTNYKM